MTMSRDEARILISDLIEWYTEDLGERLGLSMCKETYMDALEVLWHGPEGELIRRSDAIEAVASADETNGTVKVFSGLEIIDILKALPSAEAEQTMTEEVREALMRLTMCAREECDMCKYKDKCGFDFQYNISTENMHMLLDALSSVQGWIPCSERLPKEYAQYLVCLKSGECYVYWLKDSDWARGMAEKEGILAWMPLPKPYREDGE